VWRQEGVSVLPESTSFRSRPVGWDTEGRAKATAPRRRQVDRICISQAWCLHDIFNHGSFIYLRVLQYPVPWVIVAGVTVEFNVDGFTTWRVPKSWRLRVLLRDLAQLSSHSGGDGRCLSTQPPRKMMCILRSFPYSWRASHCTVLR
jgi:hypothetical protein